MKLSVVRGREETEKKHADIFHITKIYLFLRLVFLLFSKIMNFLITLYNCQCSHRVLY